LAADFLNRFEYWYFKRPFAEISRAFDDRRVGESTRR
jgi:hypothetical protein